MAVVTDLVIVALRGLSLALLARRLVGERQGLERATTGLLWFVGLAVGFQMVAAGFHISAGWSTVCLTGVAAAVARPTLRAERAIAAWSDRLLKTWRLLSPPSLAAMSLAICAIGYVGVATIGRPPWDLDSVLYHVPEIEQWIDGAELLPTSDDQRRSPHSFFPKNGELFMAALAPSAPLIVLTPAANFVTLALAASGLLLLARRLGCSRDVAVFAGALFAGNIVLHGGQGQQLGTQEVDLFGACFVPFELYLLLRLCGHTPAPRDFLLIGLSAGLAIGSKWYNLIYQAPIFLVAAMQTRKSRPLMSAWLGLVVPIALLGGVWYANNWLRFGNPFHPAQLRMFDHVVFGGEPDITECSVAVIRRNPMCSIFGEVISLVGERRWLDAANLAYEMTVARTVHADGIVMAVVLLLAVRTAAFNSWTTSTALAAGATAGGLLLASMVPATDGRWLVQNQRFALPSILVDHLGLAVFLDHARRSLGVGSIVPWLLVAWTGGSYAVSGRAVAHPTRIGVVIAAAALFVALLQRRGSRA